MRISSRRVVGTALLALLFSFTVYSGTNDLEGGTNETDSTWDFSWETEPEKPTEPETRPPETTEPEKPTEPETRPTETTEPEKPTEPETRPPETEPEKPTEPETRPTETTEPEKPTEPEIRPTETEPEKPTEPETSPSETTEPETTLPETVVPETTKSGTKTSKTKTPKASNVMETIEMELEFIPETIVEFLFEEEIPETYPEVPIPKTADSNIFGTIKVIGVILFFMGILSCVYINCKK